MQRMEKATLMTKYSLTFFLLLFTHFSQAQIQPFYLDHNNTSVSIGTIGDYFHDKTGKLSLLEVMQTNYSNQFLPIQTEFIQFGEVEGNAWVKARLNLSEVTAKPLAIQVQAPRLLTLDIYIPQINGIEPITESGQLRPLDHQKNQPYTLIPVTPSTPSNIDIYIKMSSRTAINASISVLPISDLTKGYQVEYMISGLLIGIMALIFLSNILFYSMSGNTMYLYYSVVLVNAMILHIILHEYLALLLPELFNLQAKIYNVSVLLATSATLLFSRAFLEVKNLLPIFDLPLMVLCAFNAVFAFFSAFAPDLISASAVSTLILLSALFLTTVGITASLRRVPFANYYLIARLTLFVGYSYWILNKHGIASNMTYFFWGLTSSILLEAMIHFVGVFAKSNPFLRSSMKTQADKTHHREAFSVINDLASRMRRQINTISGFVEQVQESRTLSDQSEIYSIEQANRNLENLLERLEHLNGLQYTPNQHSTNYIYVDNLIDETLNTFHELDQDQAYVQLKAPNIRKDEQVSQPRLLKHLLLTLLLEFRSFNNQILTISLDKIVNSQEGLSYLEISINPVPRHISEDNGTQLNLGVGYIHHLINQLNGKILTAGNINQEFHACIPVRYRVVDRKPEIRNIQACQLFVMDSQTNMNRKLFSLLQTWPISIIQVSDIAELHKHDIQKSKRGVINIVILLEHSGYIPQLAVQHIKPLLRMEDQCLLISDNVKMPKNFALTLGFDELIHTLELEQKLKNTIVDLTEKGLRLQNARLL